VEMCAEDSETRENMQGFGLSMPKIAVASTNPVKIQAALGGFRRMFPEMEFEAEGLSVPSDVSNQPMSDAETHQGAINRVNNAMKAKPGMDYYVGIEGGIEDAPDGMREIAWVVIASGAGKWGRGRGGTFFLPVSLADMIRAGKELGEANDILFQRTNSKQENGAVGILTGDVITRASYCSDAVCMALLPFKNPDLY